jgi:hypothetical protein
MEKAPDTIGAQPQTEAEVAQLRQAELRELQRQRTELYGGSLFVACVHMSFTKVKDLFTHP